VTEAEEKVKQIQANILAAQSRQKSYADKRRSSLEFEVGDHVYLRVSPMKGVPLLRYQRKASSLLYRSISYHRQVWTNVLSSGATSNTIRNS
jgi:hypothetical protein